MTQGRKDRIGAAFGAAADRYEDHAGVQRIAALTLADLAAQAATLAKLGNAPHILEIGCGTGLLTREIARRWPGAALIATDLSLAMVEKAGADPLVAGLFLTMDGEAPHFADAHFDLILSNLAFQWFGDLGGALARLHGLLRPGGSLIFSTMAERSFTRWRRAHAACGVVAGVPHYPTLDNVRAMLARWPDAFAFDEEYPLDCGSAKGLIVHLKGIGAVVPVEARAPLSPGDLRRVMRAFEADGAQDGYHVAFARLTRI